MVAHTGKQDFPEQADDHRHDVDRQEVQEAVQEAVVHAGRVVTGAQQRQQHAAPAVDADDPEALHRRVGLEAGVPHAHQRGRRRRDHDQDHDALQVDRIAHVRRAAREIRRREEERVDRLEKGIKLFETTTLGEQRFESVEE